MYTKISRDGKGFSILLKGKTAQQLVMCVHQLSRGEIVIPEEVIQDRLRSALQGLEGVSDVAFTCADGRFILAASVAKRGTSYRVNTEVLLETVSIDREKQIIELKALEETLNVSAEGFLSRIFQGLAESCVSSLLQDAEKSATVSESTDGLVQVNWPRITLDLSRHPLVQRINKLKIANKNAWDFVEIAEGAIQQGQLVLKGRAVR